jgi:predicted amidohydrolase YtcJ
VLIKGAELELGATGDVRIDGGKIVAIGRLRAERGEDVIDAHGGLLLPGLHDHHIHCAALAASLESVMCGPPEVTDAEDFARRLSVPGSGWLRATGYHESVAGMLDRRMLDRIVPDRPLRVQHRSGRMWFFNSAGLALLPADAPAELDSDTGRLFDADAWLREVLRSTPPSFAHIGTMLARAGVTGITDMSPSNDAVMAQHFGAEQAGGAFPQRVLLAGKIDPGGAFPAGVTPGPAKLHLHEADLPTFENTTAFIRAAHAAGRAVAVHCATEVELVFTLAAFAEAGAERGDRIEHASVAPDTAVAEIARLGLAVCSQPHFLAERGAAYRADVSPEDQPILYRLRAFLDAGVTLCGGSDAPFGAADPWASMAAAVARDAAFGADEALSPEQALDLYLRDPEALDRRRRVLPGAPADLCLLDRPWAEAREALSAERVRATFIAGRIVHQRVDQPPA